MIRDSSRQIAYQEVIPFRCLLQIRKRYRGIFNGKFLRSESDVTASVIVLVIFATRDIEMFRVIKRF